MSPTSVEVLSIESTPEAALLNMSETTAAEAGCGIALFEWPEIFDARLARPLTDACRLTVAIPPLTDRTV